MASPIEPLPVSGKRQVWSIGCGAAPSGPGGCDGKAIAGIATSGSNDVFVRVASDQERQQPQYANLVAFVVGDDDERIAVVPAVARVDVDSDSKLRTLFLGTFPGDSDVEIVLLQLNSVQQVSVKGSGDVTVGDHVLAATGGVTISAAGSSSVYATCTDAMDLTRLNIETEGSVDVQISLGHVQAAEVVVTSAGSGDLKFFTESVGVSASAVVTTTGSGDLCWSTNEDINIAKLQVAGLSSADITIAAAQVSSASCGKLVVQSVGYGSIDVGSVRCTTASVNVFGSSNVVIQASDAITGEALGSGSIHYTGTAPKLVSHSYMGLLAEPVKSSYHAPKCTQRTVRQYRGDDNVLISGPVGDGATAAQGGGIGTLPSTVPANVDQLPPLPSPGSETNHLNALLPLGFVALIAALALWRFNSSKRPHRQPRWDPYDAGGGYGHAGNTNAEKQPLVSEQRPVYI